MVDSGEIGYQIISLVRDAESQDSFKRNVLRYLCRTLKCRAAAIVVRNGEKASSWVYKVQTDSANAFTRNPEFNAADFGADSPLPAGDIRIPFDINGDAQGTLSFSSLPDHGDPDSPELSNIAGILGQSIAFRMSQAALRERVKEITCLYEITKIMHQSVGGLEQTLNEVLAVVPDAFQYPAHARACIEFRGRVYGCTGDQPDRNTLKSDIFLSGENQGHLHVGYAQFDGLPEDPSFLIEEQDLLNGIANQLSFLIEERELEEERQKLEAQLRHAERLSTLGQLAAGVAHDINEPLANILGFAELMMKNADLPEQAKKDSARIVQASVYARDIVRKLLVFTGKTAGEKSVLNLNEVILEGIRFFEERCRNQNIEIVSKLSDIPLWIQASPSEIHQILVNLLVNSIQELPEGGQIMISSRRDGVDLVFDVQDNGNGIEPEQLEKVFLPFYTTKERGRGTGLGLSTVHGIVNSYGGCINVESTPRVSTRFTVRLPGMVRVDE